MKNTRTGTFVIPKGGDRFDRVVVLEIEGFWYSEEGEKVVVPVYEGWNELNAADNVNSEGYIVVLTM